MYIVWRIIAWFGSILFSAWLLGFGWFVLLVSEQPHDLNVPVDAIVVLTGGTGRIEAGLDLLSQDAQAKLFISGVGQGVTLQQLTHGYSPERLRQCCSDPQRITLGYVARNTRGNAIEVREWARVHRYTRLRVVTSYYHMPRGLLELAYAMPTMTLIGYPVFNGMGAWWTEMRALRLVFLEYHKTLFAYALHLGTRA